ncbi:MAG: hypothetical protein Kow0063_43320 [Anaerolineae bacterium]
MMSNKMRAIDPFHFHQHGPDPAARHRLFTKTLQYVHNPFTNLGYHVGRHIKYNTRYGGFFG